VPNSILWLNHCSDSAKNTLLKKSEHYGMDPARLFFTKYNSLEEIYLHQLCDVYLETAAVNSAPNVLSALYSNKPVIVMHGTNPLSRVSNSILINANLNETICSNVEEYVKVASNLATDHKYYKNLVTKIKQAIDESPLFNQTTYTQKFEQALQDALANRISSF